MAAVTSITKHRVGSAGGYTEWIYTYTKAGGTDTLDTTSELAEVTGFFASTPGTGLDLTATNSSGTITLSTGTGAGFAVVWGHPAKNV